MRPIYQAVGEGVFAVDTEHVRPRAAPDRARRMEPELFGHLSRRLAAHGFGADEPARHALLDGDVSLNAAGLHAWLSRAA
ncbi:MAG TPA: hypothetical protein VME42_20880 [Steroidobacteraceae bacterium]|nr:hypothetical protein [Steroidobacteraceae bacterium]